MIEAISFAVCAVFMVAAGAVWSWSIRFALFATTGAEIPWRASVVVTLLVFAVGLRDCEWHETAVDLMARLTPFGVIRPLLLAAAAWVMS